MWTISLLVTLALICNVSCVRQCCQEGEVMLPNNLNNQCWNQSTNVTNSPSLDCKSYILFIRFNVSDAGSLILYVGDRKITHSVEFCVGTQTKNLNLTQIRRVAAVCQEEEDEEILDDSILGYCMIVSVVFLAITVIIYASIEELRDLQGKSIINFCGSLAIGLSILAIMKTISYSDMDLCAARGFLAYFFLIASFFWSNAISMQLLISTRQPNLIADYRWKYFKWYALYAWGCPILLTSAMAVVNFHPGDHEKPGIGLNHCWFLTKTLQWYYMYSIMTILLVANISIFVYISTIIWTTNFSSRHLEVLRYKFMMTIRLVVLMGLPWVTEMISSVMPNHIVWTIVDVFNTFQGLFIFMVLVVFRLRVIKLMHKRGWLFCLSKQIDKHLAARADDEDNVIQHTELPTIDH